MADVVPPMNVTLEWDSELQFTGLAGKHEVGIDGSTYTAPSPMQMLAFSLVGCMAVDLVHILKRGRHELNALQARFTGERAQVDPKRFTKITLHFTLDTNAPADQIQRAIDLSHEKYCSVWHSLRQDIEFTASFTIAS